MLDAEKLMSYQIGLALYDYLVLPEMPKDEHEKPWCEKTLDFEHPIFRTMLGPRVQALIEATTKPDPTERLGLLEAMKEVADIQVLLKSQTVSMYARLGVMTDSVKGSTTEETESVDDSLEPDELSLDSNQPLPDQLHYQHATLSNVDTRTHRFPAHATINMKDAHQLLVGDALKSAILGDFKKTLDDIHDPEALLAHIEDFKKKEDYKVLTKGQGLSKWLPVKTGAVIAFEKLCDEAKNRVQAAQRTPPK